MVIYFIDIKFLLNLAVCPVGSCCQCFHKRYFLICWLSHYLNASDSSISIFGHLQAIPQYYDVICKRWMLSLEGIYIYIYIYIYRVTKVCHGELGRGYMGRGGRKSRLYIYFLNRKGGIISSIIIVIGVGVAAVATGVGAGG